MFMIGACEKQWEVDGGVSGQIQTVSDEKIDFYGKTLARWASTKCVTIEINGLHINRQGPNAGGCSPAMFGGFGTSGVFRSNLKFIIEKSNCNLGEINNYLQDLSNALEAIDYSLTKEELSEDLSCLGEFKFFPTEFGPE